MRECTDLCEIEKYIKREECLYDWILNSGIQDKDTASSTYGSFRAWYDINTGKYSYAYPEITGYALTCLCGIHNDEVTKSIKAATDYLINNCLVDDNGEFHIRNISNGNSQYIYTFDVGMILKGLVCSYKREKSLALFKVCEELTHWLLDMQIDDGSFFALYDNTSNVKKSISDRWSTQSGVHHLKLIIPLLQIEEVQENVNYMDRIMQLYEWAKGLQLSSGRFVTDTVHDSTFLHAHCYALEGLLFLARKTQNKEVYDSVIAGLNWVLELFEKHMELPSVVFCDGRVLQERRADIIAQVLRLLYAVPDVADENKKIVKQMMEILLQEQCLSNVQESHGGFYFQCNYGRNHERMKKHINTWASLVVSQCMTMYHKNDCKIWDNWI